MDIPPLYTPGSTLKVKISQIYIIVTVDRVFTPFTTSHVLAVRATSSSAKLPTNYPPLGTLMILKIYDTRYLRERQACYSFDRSRFYPASPWLLQNEEKAVAYCESTGGGWDDSTCDDSAVSDEGMLTEVRMYRHARTYWTAEVDAYLVLVDSSLSGSTVPTFYGSGDLILEEARAIIPRILLLEFIPHSIAFDNVKDVKKLLTPWHIRTLIAATSKLNDLGVIHHDLEPRNVLLAPDRVVIIDFGMSTARAQGGSDMFSDEEWMAKVGRGDNERRVKMMLDALRGLGKLVRVTGAADNRAALASLDANIGLRK